MKAQNKQYMKHASVPSLYLRTVWDFFRYSALLQ